MTGADELSERPTMTPALLFLAALGAARPESPGSRADRPDKLIVPEAARLEKVWSEGSFTEGPAYGPDGCVYFSDIGNRIMKLDPATGRTTEYRHPSGQANGLDFDPQGRLVAAEGGNRRVTRTEKDGKVVVLAD